MTLVIAHRGASAYEHENSLAAFRRARDMDADGVELDVHASADGVPVVHHGPLAGSQWIAKTDVDQLRQTPLPNGEPMPTLAEALEVLKDLAVFVEVKFQSAATDDTLFAVLDHGPAPTTYHLHSFDHRIVARLRAKRPDFRYGVLRYSYPVSPLVDLRDTGAQTLWQHESTVDAGLVTTAHAEGFAVYAWTVDSASRMRELVTIGVDAVCTNAPDKAKECLG